MSADAGFFGAALIALLIVVVAGVVALLRELRGSEKHVDR